MKQVSKTSLIRMAVMLCAALGLVVCLGALAGCSKPAEEATPEPDPTQMDVKEKEVKDTNPFYVLVVGNDSRTGTTEITKPEYSSGAGRSDTMMLVRVDPKTYQIGIVTIPRDTQIELNGERAKINAAYENGGIDASLAEVKKLTGVEPKYYLDLGFVTFEQFIDKLGGITVNVPMEMNLKDIVSGDSITIPAGEQTLDGKEALVFSRVRKQFKQDQDALRQIQDRQVVQNGITKVASDPANVETYVEALTSLAKTNWDKDDLLELVKDFAAHADEISFVSGTGPYAGDFDESAGGLWLATRDEATWKQVIAAVDAHQDPTTIVPLPQMILK